MTSRIANHDLVVLTHDVPEFGLAAGDVGVVLASHPENGQRERGYTLEFTSIGGDTIAVVDVAEGWVRPIGSEDVRHARPRAHVA